jgi:hypothetical protein
MQKKLLSGVRLHEDYLHLRTFCANLLSEAKHKGQCVKASFKGIMFTASPLNNLGDLLALYWKETEYLRQQSPAFSGRSERAARPKAPQYPPD